MRDEKTYAIIGAAIEVHKEVSYSKNVEQL